ncbi:MAG: hypothetical protein QY309_13220 [Cyclobacteriaceae bacterium]|nr:MAG: hypothetical protein QY309_13220 [Cyclobacteriaceae bacterium]
MNTEIAKLLLEKPLKVINRNRAGRIYHIIEINQEMVYQGRKVRAAIVSATEYVVAPVIVSDGTGFIPTGDIPEEELTLYLQTFGG